MAFLFGNFGSNDCCTIFERIRGKHLTIDLEGNKILVDDKVSADDYILRRHGCRNLAPTTEGVAFLDRVFQSHDFRTIGHRVSLHGFTIHHIAQEV